VASVALLVIGLWNAQMLMSEKGFYGLAMVLSLFSVIAVQKNVRDLAVFDEIEKVESAKSRVMQARTAADSSSVSPSAPIAQRQPNHNMPNHNVPNPAPKRNDSL
jgi:hypothetical protein